MLDSVLATPVAYQFKVVFADTATDTSFQEVSGLQVAMQTERFQEGGENRYTHNLPAPIQQTNIVLERGLTLRSSPLVSWCKSVLEGDFSAPITTKSLMIFLLNSKGLPDKTWSVTNAFPVSWKTGAFDSMKNQIAIEIIELAHNGIVRNL